MIASMRRGLALLTIVAATLVVVPLQWGILKSGWGDPARLPRHWHRVVSRALGLRIRRRGHLAQARPLLIAANHISWTDIVVLGSLADVTFIAKSDLAGWPVFGFLSTLQRTVFVERARRGRAGAQAGEIAARLASRDAIVLFAEGSTGDGNHLLPFKSTLFGAARLALADGVDTVWIQPVAIAYTRLHGMPMGRQHRPLAAWIGDADLVPHLLALTAEGAIDVEVAFGELVPFTVDSDRKRVARHVEAEVRRMLSASLRSAPAAGPPR